MPAVVYERQQKPVFQCRKAKVRIPAETGSSLKVNTHIAETDRGLRFSRPSKSVFDARNKLPRPKRLCNIVIRTELKSRNNAVFITRSRQKNNWYILFAFHGGANNKAAAVRKRNIQQHNIKLLLFKKPQRFCLPVCAFAQKALIRQKRAQRTNDRGIILNNKHSV